MSEVVIVRDFEGKVYKVEIGKITYGQRCRIMSEVLNVKVNPLGKADDVKVDYVKFERLIVKAAIKRVDPPVDDVMKFVDSLPVDEAKKIVQKALELNPF